MMSGLTHRVLWGYLLCGAFFLLANGPVHAQDRSVFDPRTWFTTSEQNDNQSEAEPAPTNQNKVLLRRAINLASSQRMLGQRMVGAYCLAGLSNLDRSEEIYVESIEVFESQIDVLKDMALDDRVRAQLSRIETVWYRLKGLARTERDVESAAALVANSIELMDETELLVSVLIEDLDEEVGEWISIAGRQRMLGQRIASLKVCEAYGVDGSRIGLNVMRGFAELKGGQSQLENSDFVSRSTRRFLNEASNHLAELEYLLAQDEIQPVNVFEITDHYLRSMNRVAGMISELNSD